MNIEQLVADKIKFDTYYHFNGIDRISETGIDQVNGILLKYDKTLPSNFSRYLRFRNQRFTTRVRQFMHREHQIALSDDEVARIGQISQQHGENFSLVYEFTRNFDWRSGDYSDHGSCYWGGNAGAKSLIRDKGGFAILVYKPELFNIAENEEPVPNSRYLPPLKRYTTGQGRAWILPWNNSHLVVFNCYCVPLNDRSIEHRQLGIVLAAHLDLDYRSLTVTNYGSSTGLLFINSGVGTAVGENFEGIPSSGRGTGLQIDFGFDVGPYDDEEEYEDDYDYTCENCGDGIYADDAVYIADLDEYYCDHCAGRRDVWQCEYCYNHYINEEGRPVYILSEEHYTDDNNADLMCPSCVSRRISIAYVFECEDCNRFFHSRDEAAHVTVTDENGNQHAICRECFHHSDEYSKYKLCDECTCGTLEECPCTKEKSNG